MKNVFRLLVVAALAPLCLSAQATVQGDVYAVNGLGSVFRAAGTWVKIMRGDSAFRASADSLCAVFNQGEPKQKAGARLEYSDQYFRRPGIPRYLANEKLRARLGIERFLSPFRASIIDSIQASVDGHFSLSMQPGEYFLFAETYVGDEILQWMREVHVQKSSAVADLGREQLLPVFFCRQ